MEKNKLTETDIRSKFITPALLDAGWDLHTQIREEVALTSGRILVKGQKHKRGPAKYADYILYYKPNIPIAVIEAKDNNHSMGAGMQQALDYSAMLGDGQVEPVLHEVDAQHPLQSFGTAPRASWIWIIGRQRLCQFGPGNDPLHFLQK